jgi:outer membrane protein
MMRALVLVVALMAASPARATVNPTGAEGPLSLEQAVDAALAHQPQLRAARAQVRAAQARVDEATAGLLPQVNGTAGVSRSGGAGTLPSATGNVWSLGLSGSQLLYDFGQTWNGRTAASASEKSQVETERDTTQTVVLNVRSAWFTAAAARDLVAVAKETLDNRDVHLTQIAGFVEVGTRPEIDLAQARADRANALVQLITSQNTLATSLAQLNQAMGLAAPTDYELAPTAYPAVPGEDGSLDELLSEALSRRADLASLARAREAQEATVRSLTGAYGPTLSATGKVGEAGLRPDALSDSWTVGLNLSWPIFQGGRTRGQVSEANANLDALDAQAELLRQQIRLSVEQARLTVKAAKAALEASGEVVVNARQQLRLAEGRYQAGLGNGVELNDAQVAVTSAAAQEVQARFNLATARAQLARAVGR